MDQLEHVGLFGLFARWILLLFRLVNPKPSSNLLAFFRSNVAYFLL